MPRCSRCSLSGSSLDETVINEHIDALGHAAVVRLYGEAKESATKRVAHLMQTHHEDFDEIYSQAHGIFATRFGRNKDFDYKHFGMELARPTYLLK